MSVELNEKTTGGSIARQMMKDAGMPIDDAKLQEAQRRSVEATTDNPGTSSANNGDTPDGDEGAAAAGAAAATTPAADGQPGADDTPAADDTKPDPTKAAAAKPVAKPAAAPKVDEPAELDDKALLKALNLKNGTNYKSLDELKPAPKVLTDAEKLALDKQDEDAAVAYALENKLLTRDTLEQYAVDKNKNPREIALQIFGDKLKEIDPEIAPEKIDERFSEYFHEFQDDGSPLKILGEQSMKGIADSYIKDKYGDVINIKEPYTKHKTSTEQAQVFRNQINDVAKNLPRELKFTVPVEGEGGAIENLEYSFTVGDDVIKQIKADFLKPETFEAFRQRGLDEAGIADAFDMAVQKKQLSNMISVVAKSHADKMRHADIATRKNIPSQAGKGTPQKLPSGNRNSVARAAMSTT